MDENKKREIKRMLALEHPEEVLLSELEDVQEDLESVKKSLSKFDDPDFLEQLQGITDEELQEALVELRDEIEGKLNNIKLTPGPKGDKGDRGERGEKGKDGKDGEDGKDGKDGKDGRDGKNGKDGKDGDEVTAEQVRDKLETLKKDERLDVSAIKGLDDFGDGIEKRAIDILDQRTQFLINKKTSTTFQALTDTPSSYSGQSLKSLRVNSGETALEFYTPTDANDAAIWGNITGTITDQTDLTTYIANQLATQDTLQEVTDNGATTTNEITLNGTGLITDYVKFNTGYTVTGSEPIGAFYWDSIHGTGSLKTSDDSVLQLGQETRYYGKASGDISNGELVQFAGSQGDHVLFKKVVPAEVIANSRLFMGVATEDIANGEFGNVTRFGYLTMNTTGWTAGDLLYFDNTTGQLTNTAPSAPEVTILVAAVVKEESSPAAANGIILVRPTWGHKMQDLDDFDGTPLTTDGQIPVWDNTNQYFDPNYNINDYVAEGNVALIKDDGTIDTYTASADTDSARGTAFDTAYADAVSGDTVVVGAGEYEVTIDLKDGVNIHLQNGATLFSNTSGEPLFSDETGSVTVQITGQGKLENRSASAGANILYQINTSSIYMEGIHATTTQAPVLSNPTNGTGTASNATVTMKFDYYESPDGTFDSQGASTVNVLGRKAVSTTNFVLESDGGILNCYIEEIETEGAINAVERASAGVINVYGTKIIVPVNQPCVVNLGTANQVNIYGAVLSYSGTGVGVENDNYVGYYYSTGGEYYSTSGAYIGGDLVTDLGGEKGLQILHSAYTYRLGDIDGGESQSYLEILSASGESTLYNSNLTVGGNITATSFITSGGTSSQFVKGDGSLDSTTYALTSQLHDPVTVSDSSEIDFTLTGQDLTASLIAGSIAKSKLDSGVQASLGLADSALQSESDTLNTVTGRGSTTTNSIGVGGITINSAYSLPAVDGSANQIIKTDGAGNLSWYTPSTITDTFATIQVDGVAVSTNAPTLDFDSTYFTLTESPTDDFDITLNTTALDSLYLKLDTSNDPLTGNLEILKTDPEFRLTYNDANGYYTRLYRTTSNTSYLKSQVTVPAIASNALRFDGTGSRSAKVTDNDMLALGSGLYTETAWVKTSATDTTLMTIMGAYNGSGLYTFYKASDDTWYAGWVGSGGQNISGAVHSINDGNWHFVVLRRTSTSSIELWIDNSLIATKTGITNIAMTQPVDFEIGSLTAVAGREWDGDIDEVAIWSRALTDDEIGDLYNSGSGLYLDISNTFPSSGTAISTNLICLYHLDEGTGTAFSDSSGNGYDGVLVNSPTWINPGFFAETSTVQDVSVLTITNGSGAGEKGVITLGNTTSNTNLNGGSIDFDIGINTRWTINSDGDLLSDNDSNIRFKSDSAGMYFGAGDDSYIYDNGSQVFYDADYQETDTVTRYHRFSGIDSNASATTRPVLMLEQPYNNGVAFAKKAGFYLGSDGGSNGRAILDVKLNPINASISPSNDIEPSFTTLRLYGNGDIKMPNDTAYFYQGAGDDVRQYYDGTNWIFEPKVVGSGLLNVQGGVKFDEKVYTNVTTVTSTTHTAGDEHTILCDDDTAGSAVTVTLPAVSGNSGLQYHIKKLGSTANVIIDGNASETIDGDTTFTLLDQHETVTLVCDGSNWFII